MDTVLAIISMVIAIAALILCFRAWRGLRAVSKPQPRAGYKHSALERRRKSLELATKEWNRKLSRGHIFLAGEQKHLVDQLEREVAALENELFGAKEEESATPKPKTPKSGPVVSTKIDSAGVFGFFYTSDCSLCGWSFSSYSKETAEEKGTEHERTHA